MDKLRYPTKKVKIPFAPDKKKTFHPNEIEKTICGICGKEKSRYVCPRCNIFYCSLGCFRSESHSQCSESFYSSAIREAISIDPKTSSAERQGMLKILERFESVSKGGGAGPEEGDEADDKGMDLGAKEMDELMRFLSGQEGEEGGGEGEGGDEWDEVREKLESVDLDSLPSQDLFNLLPPAQRKSFLTMLEQPDSLEVQKLLASAGVDDGDDNAEESAGGVDVLAEGGLGGVVGGEVWWRVEDDLAEGSDDDDGQAEVSDNLDKGKARAIYQPDMVDEGLLSGIVVKPEVGMGLRYNILAVCIAYQISLLHLQIPSISSLSSKSLTEPRLERLVSQLKELMAGLVPFLVAVRSTKKFERARDGWEEVWEKFGEVKGEHSMDITLSSILDDDITLIRPPIDLTLPHAIQLILSDLHRLFTAPITPSPTSKDKAIARKLVFYISAVRQYKRAGWMDLVREVEKGVERLRGQSEGDDGEEEAGELDRERTLNVNTDEGNVVRLGQRQDEVQRPKIVEL